SDITANPQNSVCPAGWRLPTASSAGSSTAGSTNEFMRLNYIYNNGSTNSKAMEGSPLFFVRGGSVSSSLLSSSGHYGGYWSSTVSDYYYPYSLYFGNSFLYNNNSNNGNGYGYSGRLVRCVAR
ncbi:hypothetical protein IJH01_01450, partial [Candidatus Saccharibacteria bacterium]|nr:hypothetical protein [Candidatus Saccharibacteria bacterium]